MSRRWRALSLLEKTLVALAAFGFFLAVVLLATRPAVQAIAPVVTACFALVAAAFVNWARRNGLFPSRD